MSPKGRYGAALDGLPQDWRTVQIAQLGKVISGGTPSREVPAYWGGDIPWLTPGELTSLKSKNIKQTNESITEQGLNGSGANLLPAGSLLITTRATLGARAINTVPMATNQGFKSIVFQNPKDADYYYYWAEKVESELIRRASGTTFLEISGSQFCQISVPYPPGREQEKIAQILDTLDTQIRQTEALIAKLERVKQGLLTDLLTRGIDQNGQLRPTPEQAPHTYQDSPVGPIPKEWVSKPLSSITKSLVDGPFGSNLKTEHYVLHPGIRVVRLQNISSGEYNDTDKAYITESHASHLSRNTVMPGDVLIAALGDDTNPVGRTCLYPDALPPAINKADCFRLRSQGSFALNEFVMLYMNSIRASTQVKKYQQGVTLQRINLSNLRAITMAVPPIREQFAICRIAAGIRTRLHSAKSELEKLQIQKSGLMDDLLTGRVRVTPLLEAKGRALA
jgi:type I restriction enzyme, S subunit